MDEIIMERLSQPNTDERKIMSFLISPQAGPMLAAAAPDSPVQKLVDVAQAITQTHRLLPSAGPADREQPV